MLSRFLSCVRPTPPQPLPRSANLKPGHDGSRLQNASIESEKEMRLVEKMLNWKDCIAFVPPITGGVVIKVYDGDTITIASKLPYEASPLYRFAVRLNGIDAPEIKGKTNYEKHAALVAKTALEERILNKTVTLKNASTEKYGRILADVYLGEVHLNKWMLDEHYAVPYEGGTKKEWKPVDEDKIN
jgi:endonuclease YncB( thermonuclease family)